MNEVLVSGGTGFIGRALVRALAARGDEPVVLSRNAAERASQFEGNVRLLSWVPGERGDWASELERSTALVHLAGEQAVGRRLSERMRREIEQSRIATTERFVEALSHARRRPRVFVCASAIGYYGAREPDEALDESSPSGSGFLAELTRAWEAAALRAADSGVRVVLARFGIVLGRDGGALAEMARPFRLFVGGPIGSGRQIVSWVHLEDAVRALLLMIDDERLSGPVNVVAPNPVDNRTLARAIGRTLGRPAWLPVPAFALEAMFGEAGAEPMLTGQRVVPAALAAVGFRFSHPTLESALAEALG